jgi:imidazolonepropionase-like amidohydrolase
MKGLLLLLGCALGAFAETKLLKNATVIDGTGSAAKPETSILVVDGHITQIGHNIKAPKDAEVIDLTGKYVIPGLIASHGHLGNTKGFIQDPKNFTRENAELRLLWHHHHGVDGK